jgi:hypothetical protein
MNDNPYQSPTTPFAADPSTRPIRMNGFDKFCATIAFLFAIVFLLLGCFGAIVGCRAYIILPPVLGALPAFAGWGIIRAVIVAWKLTNQSKFGTG